MSEAFTICIVVLAVMALMGAPISLSMIASAVVWLVLKKQDLGLAAEQMLQSLYDGFLLLAIPLFIVSANIMNAGAISDRLLGFCIALVGRFRGGLGHVNVVANMIFAGMSGSAVADAVGLGKVVIDMMRKENRYSPGYAAAITAAASTIGPIIPPSIPMVMYALVSDTSIGYMFLGGIVPGLIMGLVLMLLNWRTAHARGFPVEAKIPFGGLVKLTLLALPALLTPVILLAGIYGGAVTPTEAAALAALWALIAAVIIYPLIGKIGRAMGKDPGFRPVSFGSLRKVMTESSRASASVGLVIGASLIFNYIVASEQIPASLLGAMKGLDTSPIVFMIAINLLFLILGCLLDASTLILVIVPLFVPTCRALGIDMVHFGVVIVVNCMIGLITPPYGVLLFVVNAVTGISLKEIISEIWSFIAVLVVALFIMILVPQTVLWVPKLFGYQPSCAVGALMQPVTSPGCPQGRPAR